jgi:hypothetical protein
MSSELETKMAGHTVVKFWGGDNRGVCLQITANPIKIAEDVLHQLQNPLFIQLTMEEGAALLDSLSEFVKEEALRRQALLKEEIADLKVFERTIFKEIADLQPNFYEVYKLKIDYVSKFCPKVKKLKEKPDEPNG